MGLSNELSCESGSFSSCHLNSHRCFQSEVWGFISPSWNPGLHGLSHSPDVPPSLSACECGTALPASRCLAHLCPSAATLLQVLSTKLPMSAPPTSLDECFFFNSLVVRLPYSSIFCQFLLFFVFKFVVLLLVVRGGTVCLPTPPSWLELSPHTMSC